MHPMFVKLFIEPGSGYPLTEEDEKRRRWRRAGRHRSPMLVSHTSSRPSSQDTRSCLMARTRCPRERAVEKGFLHDLRH
jgi:hypothetical protein